MCTLTFIPAHDGYTLAMNRDGRTNRGADAPMLVELDGVSAIYPRDVEGGTWVAVNHFGAAFALLNWNDVPTTSIRERSRGDLIPAVVGCSSGGQARNLLAHLNLKGMLPFRGLACFPQERQVHEWTWDLTALTWRFLSWDRHHWCSSSLSDKKASHLRKAVFDGVCDDASFCSPAWLRKLHASHEDGPGFSICVHRGEVQTLSYTEILCSTERVQMGYFGNSPCALGPIRAIEIERVRSQSLHLSGVLP